MQRDKNWNVITDYKNYDPYIIQGDEARNKIGVSGSKIAYPAVMV